MVLQGICQRVLHKANGKSFMTNLGHSCLQDSIAKA